MPIHKTSYGEEPALAIHTTQQPLGKGEGRAGKLAALDEILCITQRFVIKCI